MKQWINECLAGQRIIVKDLQEDLFDGQVLQRLFEHLEGGKEKIDKPDIVCTKQGQLDKLNYVLKRIQDRCEGYHRELFGDDDEERLNEIKSISFIIFYREGCVISIYTKNYFAICYLLVILTKFYDDKCNVRLPEKIEFKMVFLRKNPDGTITRQTRSEPMFTSVYENGYPTHRKNE